MKSPLTIVCLQTPMKIERYHMTLKNNKYLHMKTILQFKKLLIITLLFLVGNVCVGQPSAFEVTSDLNTKIGQCIDMDNAYGCQCVDLAKYVCITYWGQNIVGNANQLDELNRWPSGTIKINYYSGFIPQQGDFYIWNNYGTNGHIGYITSATSTTYTSLDENFVNASSNGSPLAVVNHSNYNNVTCVMRLPYSSCPSIPTTTTPSNAQTNVGIPVFFNWDDVSGPNPQYRIHVSTVNSGWSASNGFTTNTSPSGNVVVNQGALTDSFYQWSQYVSGSNPFVPQANTTYYYTVKSFVCGQNSNYSPVKSFTTGCAASTPVINSPSNGQTGLTTPINFSWQASSGTSPQYRIQITTNPNTWNSIDGFTSSDVCNSTVVVNRNTGSTNSFQWNTTTIPNDVCFTPQPNTTYYWSVKTHACNHSSNWSAVRSFTVGSTTQNYTINTSSNPTVGGSTSGSGTFVSGSSRTVTATPNTGYTFTNWTENGTQVFTNASYTFTLSSNRNLVANFTQNQTGSCLTCPNYDFSLSINSSWGNHSSSILSNGCKIYRFLAVPGRTYTFKTGCGDGATANFDTYLELMDNNCTSLSNNDDGCTTPSNTSQIQWTCNYTSTNWIYLKVRGYNANFGNYTLAYQEITPITSYTISTSSSPTIGGSTTGGGTYNNGDSCYVTSTPNTGYTFTNWTENGVQVSANQNFTFTVTGNRNLVANFSQNQTTTCLTCPNYDFSTSINSSWGNHSSSILSNGCKIYRFLAVPGRTYTFKTGCGDGATATFDTYLDLFDNTCTGISSNDDGCTGATSILNWTCNYNTTNWVYLKVKGWGASNFGSYTLAYLETQALNNNEYDFLKEDIIIYPIPTNNKISINAKDSIITKIDLFDIQGRKVLSNNYNDTKIELNLSTFANGTYLLKVYSNDKSQIHKIIKN